MDMYNEMFKPWVVIDDRDRRFFGPKHWAEPLKWQKQAAAAGERRRVFCASMADVFERHMDQRIDYEMDKAREHLFRLIAITPWLDWLLLTKRPENIWKLIPSGWFFETPQNVWLGTSVENQEQADTRIPELLKVPAAVRFLSCEPLLGPVDLYAHLFPTGCSGGCDCRWPDDADRYDCGCDAECCTEQWPHDSGIHWVIAGGESGPGARPMHPDWARALRDQCQAAGVAFHFKQWGNWAVTGRNTDGTGAPILRTQPDTVNGWLYLPDGTIMQNVGKKAAGRVLDGRTWDEFPTVNA